MGGTDPSLEMLPGGGAVGRAREDTGPETGGDGFGIAGAGGLGAATFKTRPHFGHRIFCPAMFFGTVSGVWQPGQCTARLTALHLLVSSGPSGRPSPERSIARGGQC